MSPAQICLIVAIAENGVIGRDGKMPWHLPAELKYFRERTIGKPVIMGRKTFQSIGKPLPGRDNIVITRDATFSAAGVVSVGSIEAAVAEAQAAAAASGATEIMVIGGADIYRQSLPLADRVYLTLIAALPEGDATFPALDEREWRLVQEKSIQQGDAATFDASARVYERQR